MADFHPLRSRRPSEADTTGNTNNDNNCYNGDFHCDWERLDQAALQLAAAQPTRACVPSLDHLGYRDYDDVYEPSDDTYLLLDALQYEFSSSILQNNNKNNKHRSSSVLDNGNTGSENEQDDIAICLEIGCGSGVPSVYFRAQWIDAQNNNKNDDDTVFVLPPLISYVTDINPKALEVTQRTFAEAARLRLVNPHCTAATKATSTTIGMVEAVRCDLASALLPRLEQCVSYLLFNPPYVPTPDADVYRFHTHNDDNSNNCNDKDGIEASWAGGRRGRRVVDRAIPQMARILKRPHGVAYLVTVDDNRPCELGARFAQYGLQMRPLFRRRAQNEFLTIQKITWMGVVHDGAC